MKILGLDIRVLNVSGIKGVSNCLINFDFGKFSSCNFSVNDSTSQTSGVFSVVLLEDDILLSDYCKGDLKIIVISPKKQHEVLCDGECFVDMTGNSGNLNELYLTSTFPNLFNVLGQHTLAVDLFYRNKGPTRIRAGSIEVMLSVTDLTQMNTVPPIHDTNDQMKHLTDCKLRCGHCHCFDAQEKNDHSEMNGSAGHSAERRVSVAEKEALRRSVSLDSNGCIGDDYDDEDGSADDHSIDEFMKRFETNSASRHVSSSFASVATTATLTSTTKVTRSQGTATPNGAVTSSSRPRQSLDRSNASSRSQGAVVNKKLVQQPRSKTVLTVPAATDLRRLQQLEVRQRLQQLQRQQEAQSSSPRQPSQQKVHASDPRNRPKGWQSQSPSTQSSAQRASMNNRSLNSPKHGHNLNNRINGSNSNRSSTVSQTTSKYGSLPEPADLASFSVGRVSRLKVLIDSEEARRRGFLPQQESAEAALESRERTERSQESAADVISLQNQNIPPQAVPFVQVTRRELLEFDSSDLKGKSVKLVQPPPIYPPEPALLCFRT